MKTCIITGAATGIGRAAAIELASREDISNFVLIALGMKDLEETINKMDVDLVISATPIDLTRIITINKPVQRVRYELEEIGKPDLVDILQKKFAKK